MRRDLKSIATAAGALVLSVGGVWMVVDELARGQAHRRWGDDVLRDAEPTTFWLHLTAHGLATLFIIAGTVLFVRGLVVRPRADREGER